MDDTTKQHAALELVQSPTSTGAGDRAASRVVTPTYLGSKAASGSYQRIIAAFPPHNTYIETHLGSGAIAARKPPAPLTILIDRDLQALRASPAQGLKICADAASFIRSRTPWPPGTLIYADPPYLPETRSSAARYRHEYTRDDHVDLVQSLAASAGAVAISGYPSSLYDELLAGWRKITWQAMTRGGVRTECLWMNYEASAAWHSYAGRDRTDRQRIKRKAGRWAANFAKLPQAEQLAILDAINNAAASPPTTTPPGEHTPLELAKS